MDPLALWFDLYDFVSNWGTSRFGRIPSGLGLLQDRTGSKTQVITKLATESDKSVTGTGKRPIRKFSTIDSY